MRNEDLHGSAVDAWLSNAGKGLSNDQLLRLFEQAMAALWTRTLTTLGDVTLSAVARRVLHEAAEKHPVFAGLTVEADRGIRTSAARPQALSAPQAEVLAALRFVLVEFLSVLGTLTADVLTPELHAQLAKVTPRKVALAAKGGMGS